MLSLPNPIASLALARPQHGVLQSDGVVWTAAALRDAVARQAHQLAQVCGVGCGQRVGLFGPSNALWWIHFHALAWLGCTVVLLPERLTAVELQHAVAVARPDRIVHLSEPPGFAIDTALQDARIDSARAPPLDDTAEQAAERFWPLEEARAIVLTSGSTAAPRAVVLTVAQLLFASFGSMTRLGHLPDDVWLSCLPLHHVSGLAIGMRAAWSGARVRLMSRFDAAAVAAELDSGTIALTALVPTMLERVLVARAGRPFPPQLRAILLGGAPPSEALLTQCQQLGVPVSVCWGMSETAAHVTSTWPGAPSRGGDCGPPLPFARIEAVQGTLQVSGPQAGPTPLRTADRGHVDPSGHVYVHGRCDDIIISGGEKIVPEEVEAVLRDHAAIADAAVVAADDSRWGQRPWAVLVPRADAAQPSDAMLKAWCQQFLASYKIPDRFVWCATLPRDGLGKLRRRALSTTSNPKLWS